MILTARYVRQPRERWCCDWCENLIVGRHIYLYGGADTTERPGPMRLHPTERCCPNLEGDAKIAAALKESEAAP